MRKDETVSDADSFDDPVSTRVSSSASTRQWWTWFHLLSFAAAGMAWCVDEHAFRFFNNWYNGPKPPNGELHQLILSSAMFGQGLGMVLSVLLVWLLDPRKHRAAVIAIVLAASGLASSAGKMVVGRERPLESKGASVFHGPWKGPISSRQQSMPSGHTTTAAALAVVLAYYYPRLRGLMIVLTAGVGINRVVTVAHYPSDVVVGAWLGTCVASALVGRNWLTAWSMQLAWRMRAFAESLAAIGLIVRVHARRWGRGVLGSPWLATLAGLFLFWAGNGATPLWDRDEPRFATAAREMLERNDWIVPTFNGDLRPDKPILVYWLMMIAYSIFGVGTFAARFFSGVAGASAVFATSLLGKSMFDRRVGLTAAWIVALSPMVVVESKICTADGVLFGFLTWGTYFLWRLANGVGGQRTSFTFWLMLALACLTKGPVAVGVIGGTALIFSLVTRDFRWIAGLGFRRGLFILVVVLGPWCWAVQDSTNGEFLAVALGKHVVERSTTSLENHRGFPGYYILSLVLLMTPWGWALPWAVHRHGRRFLEDRRLAFLLAWLVGPLVIFEAVRTKLVHYYLPAYPAAALVLASAWVGRFAGAPLGAATIRPWLGGTTAFAGVVVSLFIVVAGCVFFPQELAVPGALSIGLFGMALATSGALLSWRMPLPAFRTMVVGVWASLAIAVVEFLPVLGTSRPIYEVAQRLKARRGDTIAFWNYRDPSIIFNLGGGVYPVVDPLRGKPPLLDSQALASSKPFLCPMTPELLADMAGDRSLRTEIVESVSKWDGATLRHRTVHLVRVSRADPAVAAAPAPTKK